MSYLEDDDYTYRYDDAMLQLEAETLRQTSEENIKTYLGKYGDEVSKRIETCKKSANLLIKQSEYEAALIRAFTGIEILIKYLVVLPTLQGALLQNDIAEILVARILFDTSRNYKDLFNKILKLYNIDLSEIKINEGRELWKTVNQDVIKKRNLAVHMGEPCNEEDALLAMHCLSKLETEIVHKIADKFGFTLQRTGKWSTILWEDESNPISLRRSAYYQPSSPFKTNLS